MITTTIKTDTELKTHVLDELRWDTTVDETEVGVQTRNGVVTLSGNVSSYAKRIAAVAAAHRVFGVRDVVDNMQVSLPLAGERTDEDLATAIRHAFMWNGLVPHERITTTVRSGFLTLEGAANTWNERQEAEATAQRITGVKGITNRIAIIAKAIDASAIKQRIENALERQAEYEAKRIGVYAVDGVVTLTGAVRSWAEKNAVERVAWATDGVSRVDDQTTIDPYQ